MRVKEIFRDNETSSPYLVRYYLFKCRFFQIVLHKILLSDNTCLHDHPWFFISWIIKGGYWERIPVSPPAYRLGSELNLPELMGVKKKWFGPTSMLFRPAKWMHSLELPKGKTAWTVVVMFKRQRSWGFWTRLGFKEPAEYDYQTSCE